MMATSFSQCRDSQKRIHPDGAGNNSPIHYVQPLVYVRTRSSSVHLSLVVDHALSGVVGHGAPSSWMASKQALSCPAVPLGRCNKDPTQDPGCFIKHFVGFHDEFRLPNSRPTYSHSIVV